MEVHVVAFSAAQTEDVSRILRHDDMKYGHWRWCIVKRNWSVIITRIQRWNLLQKRSPARPTGRTPIRSRIEGQLCWCGICRRGGRSGGIAKTILVDLEERDTSATLLESWTGGSTWYFQNKLTWIRRIDFLSFVSSGVRLLVRRSWWIHIWIQFWGGSLRHSWAHMSPPSLKIQNIGED